MKEDTSTWDIVKATQYGVFERCKELVEAGFDVRTPDADNITVLHWAAINNRLEIARYYISLGAVVDVLGGDLRATPLHWAIREGHLPMIVLLMQFGADPGVKDSDGCAALHVAVQCGYTSIVTYLIAKGSDVDSYDSNGKTPLMWAAWRTFGVDPTRALLSLYGSVNQKDQQYHNTPLHWACMAQNSNVVMLLVRAGADLDAKNSMGETALDIAQQKGNNWIVGRLKEVQRERGMIVDDDNFLKRLQHNKIARKRLTFALPFVVIFFIGFILQVSLDSWLLKAAIALVFYGSVHTISMMCLNHQETLSVLSISISVATKFWTYMTSLLFYLPVTYSLTSQFFYLTTSASMWYCFYKVVRSDPGIIQVDEASKKRTIVHMAETNNLRMETICSSCLIAKPLRSKHCAVTNKCVARYDHYCPWVLNAIGAGNHHYFMLYLIALLSTLLWHLLAAFNYWSVVDRLPDDLVYMDRMWYHMKSTPWVVWIFLNTCFHFIWVFLLLASQIYQMIFCGVTTNERINAFRYDHFKTTKHGTISSKSPFDRGVINNSADLFRCSCFGLANPQFIDWRSKMQFPPHFAQPPSSTTNHHNHQTV